MSDAGSLQFSLLGYYWLQPPEAPDEEIALPPGWIESMSPFDAGYFPPGMDDVDECYVYLPVGFATKMSRGFDQPNERLNWYLRRRIVTPSES